MDSLCKNYCLKTNLNIDRSFFKKKLKQNCTNLEMQPIFKIWPVLIINKLIPIQFAHRIRITPPPKKKMTRKALEIQCIQESLSLVTLWIYIVQQWFSCSFKGLVQSYKETAAEKERQTDQASRNANEVRNFGHGGNPAHHGGKRHCSLLIVGMALVEETIVTWVFASFVSRPEKTRSILMLFNFKILSSHHMDIAKTKIWTDTLWPSYVKQGNQDLLVSRKTGPLYYDELKQKIVCVFLITQDEKLRVNQLVWSYEVVFIFVFFLMDFLSSWITNLPMVTILNYQEKMIIHWPQTENALIHLPKVG